MVAFTDTWRKQYEDQFGAMVINPGKFQEAIDVARKIEAHKDIYLQVQKATGVPWEFVGIVHYREASLDFSRYLGDGEPLDHPTHNVPKGRGPFKSFFAGCFDALTHQGLHKVKDWRLGAFLFHLEELNGEGYHNHGLPSPYVFAGTSIYTHGMYLTDGHFSYTAVDHRIGGAVILAALYEIGAVQPLEKGSIRMATETAAPVTLAAQAAPAPSAASVATDLATLAKTSFTSIWTAIGGMFGSTAAGTIIALLVAQLPAGTLAYLTGAVGLAGTAVGLAASAYHLISHVSATNNATIALAEKSVNTVQDWLKLPHTDFSSANG